MESAERDFQIFLDNFIPNVAKAEKRATIARWQSLTKGSRKAEKEDAVSMAMFRKIFSDREIYDRLMVARGLVSDPLLSRQLEILILGFKENMLPPNVIDALERKEAALCRAFSDFRPTFEGRKVNDSVISEVLATETNIARRMAAWEASKQVGLVIAPLLRDVVLARNESAQLLGYPNYFVMSYELNELDSTKVFALFNALELSSRGIRRAFLKKMQAILAKRFGCDKNEIGPWAWFDPFAQEDPLADYTKINRLFAGQDVIRAAANFYRSIGLNVDDIVKRSDCFERKGKSQHAFCFDIDRAGDIRILANTQPTFYWFGIWMHELGHGSHDKYINPRLPWLLRTDAHTLTTEAAAMLGGNFAHRLETLQALFSFGGFGEVDIRILRQLETSNLRRRFIFAPWVMVAANFEKSMYENPNQNLQKLWWELVEHFQGIRIPKGREDKADYAAKIHISTHPCYYQNYLLAEILAVQLASRLKDVTGATSIVGNISAGEFLKKEFYAQGASYRWDELIRRMTGEDLDPSYWVESLQHKTP